MPDVTKVNLDEVEDMAPQFGLSPGLEARFARRALGLSNLGISRFRYSPGFRAPFGHRHAEQEEAYVVLSGSARLKAEDEIIELGPWDAVRVPAGVTRAMEAGPEGCELLAVGAPIPEEMDAEMLPGWWSDEPASAGGTGG